MSMLSMGGTLQVKDIARRLRMLVEGQVLSEEWQRAIYATDASSYEVMPLCVVLPRSEKDVVNVVRFAWENRVPVVARGGGSGLAGQAIGSGIILDFTRYMNRLLNVNLDENYVVVEPGVYKSNLDQHLKKLGRFLPPDPASSDYCTVGGNIATNASGPHTVKYGSIIDYVKSLRVVLANGELVTTSPIQLDSPEWLEKTSKENLESKAYLSTRQIVEKNLDLIKEKTPKVRKNSSGYRLETVVSGDRIDLGRLFVSSEGTLGIVVQAKLRILKLPSSRGLALVHFRKYEDAGAAVAEILRLKPSAVELIDHRIISLASTAYPELRDAVPEGVKAVLLVEFDGDSSEDVSVSFKRLQTVLTEEKQLALSVSVALGETETRKLWEIRKKALPIVMKIREEGRRPVAFVEDTIVDPKHLAAYIKALYEIYDKNGVIGVVWGHAGDGNIHTRPLIDMKSDKDLYILQSIVDEVYNLVWSYHGSITAEHGDGLARTGYLPKQYGSEVCELFKQVKTLFDPRGILNPGKKVSEEAAGLLLANLRYGASYQRRAVETALNWGIKGNAAIKKITGYDHELDYASEVELCHGCGYCRETVYSGRMCPVFKGLGNEVDSCRGRNNLLRWMLKIGGLAQSFELTEEYREAIYKHCIECMMCCVDCPSNVNVGKLMAEARAKYAAIKGLPKGYKYFAEIDTYGGLGCKLAPFSNRMMQSGAFRLTAEWLTGVSRKRMFPPFYRKTFSQRFKEYEQSLSRREFSKSAVFFYDTYLNYNNPDLGMAIVKILEKSGVRTIVPPQKSSGLPALVEGAPERGREIAEFNTHSIAPYVEKGSPVVCFSPSAGITLKMQYLNVLDTREVRLVADNTYDLHEYLYSMHRKGELNEDFKPVNKDVLVHLHCHSIVQKVDEDVFSLLQLIPSLKVERLEKGCCGVGGSYSFIKGNYELSMHMGKALFESVRTAGKPVYTTGESCMLQMQQGSGSNVGLTVDLIRESYGL